MRRPSPSSTLWSGVNDGVLCGRIRNGSCTASALPLKFGLQQKTCSYRKPKRRKLNEGSSALIGQFEF